ncbi:PKD domain-containing protein, partial [Geoglobus sp.]
MKLKIGMTVVFFLLLVLGGANAATQISSCTQISQPGYYVLTADIIDNTSSVCIRISTSDVILDGQNHVVDGVFAPYSIGVYASLNLRNITVKNLNVSQWGTGIEFLNVQDGVISGNNVSSNYDSTRGYGIYIVGSASKNISITDNVLINNTASNNYGAGIYITAGTNYTIANNTIISNNNGITLQVPGSAPLSDCRIYNNTIKSSDFYGVYISSSSQADSYAHTIHDNTIDSNGYAVKVYQSYSNEVFNNTLANNNYGVYLYQSDNNTVYRNDFSNNIDIAVYQSKDDLIYLNNFASGAGGISVQDTTSVEFWNSTGLIVYSYNGQQYTSALGNYWTGYSGPDGDGNGVGDTAYSISGSNVDYKPLMQQFGSYLVLGYAPHADFTYSPANPAVVDTVIFDASPSYDRDGAVVSYAWDFGDGTTASGVTASHTYSSPGTYTVNLTVTDNDGLSSTTSKQITVTNNPPVISLVSPPDGQAFNPSTGHVELQWSAFDPDGDPVSYDLYFGNSANPPLNQTGLTVTSYNVSVSAGSTYYWKVVAKDSNGGTNASEVRSFRVMEYPSASFFYSPSAPAKTDLIIFDASSSYDPDGSIVSYSWDFGDGSSASGVTVSHIYASNGVYTVNLTVTDDDGLSDTVSKQVVIVEVSSLVITYNSTSIPETPSNYYFFYSDSDTITVDVRINTTPSLGPDSIAVSADFSYVNLSDNNILDGHNIVYNNSGKADGDYYRFTLSYSLSNVQVNTSIPVMIPIYLNISGQVRLVNYSVAIINFDPKEDIPGLNNPETTSWRNIEDFSNVTGLTFQHSSAGSVDGKLEILEPVNLLDRDFVQNLDRLGSNLIMASKAMSINNVTTAMKEFNKSSRITIYNLTTDSLVIYAIPEGSDQPVEVFNWFTGYADQSYLSGNPVVAEMSNGNYSVTFTVNHWTTYGVSETPVVNLNTNETFTTIQAAVSSPNTTDGHVIFIGNGTYDESVAVNK